MASARLSERDAAFATELAYGTLRWQGLYDAILSACLDRPLDRLDGRVKDALRLGTHQLLAMRVAPHAAVTESVTLARDVAGESSAGVANAVLRRIALIHDGDAEDRRAAWITQVAPTALGPEPTRADLAIAYSHPAWIVSAFGEALAQHPPRGVRSDEQAGPAADDLARLLAADNVPARPTLVARTIPVADLLALPNVTPGRWSPLAGTLERGRPEDLALVRSGAVGVQDEGSQLVALALANAPLDGPDTTWVDLAAGPGGKAALLANAVAARGGRLIAIEPHAHRAELVRRSLPPGDHETGQHEVRVADGRDALVPGIADRVLLDAPCTGIGALRRRPEARWRRTPADLTTLGPLQRDLLGAALDVVRPGGVVAYVTCSPHVAETDLVVADVLRRRERDGKPAVTRLDARPLLPGVPDLGEGPEVRLWPHIHGTDGMYLALLRRDP